MENAITSSLDSNQKRVQTLMILEWPDCILLGTSDHGGMATDIEIQAFFKNKKQTKNKKTKKPKRSLWALKGTDIYISLWKPGSFELSCNLYFRDRFKEESRIYYLEALNSLLMICLASFHPSETLGIQPQRSALQILEEILPGTWLCYVFVGFSLAFEIWNF